MALFAAIILVLPALLGGNVLVAIGIFVVAWRLRARRLKKQQETLRVFHGLSEEIIAATTPAAIADKLAAVLPTVTQASSVNLYLYQRRTKSLERIPTAADPEPMAASIDAPPERPGECGRGVFSQPHTAEHSGCPPQSPGEGGGEVEPASFGHVRSVVFAAGDTGRPGDRQRAAAGLSSRPRNRPRCSTWRIWRPRL